MTSELPDSTEAFRLGSDASITVGRLRAGLHAGPLAALAGRRVAVRFRDDRLAAPALWLLDGTVPQIMLLSADGGADAGADGGAEASREALRRQLARAAIEVLVTDRDDPEPTRFPELEIVRIHGVDELLPGSSGTDGTPAQPTFASDWLIPTSGTTGTPKVVVHRLETLTRTIRTGAPDRGFVWGLAYGIGRFAGLQVLLQAVLSGRPLVIADPDASLVERLETFSTLGVDALSATPSLWRRILMSPASDGLALRQITLGGEIADDTVLAALAQRWPEARVTHVYASTEAGVGFSVNDGRAGFPAAWLTDPPPSIELAVDGDGGLRLRPGRRLQRLLDGPGLFDPDGFIDTGDLVRRDGDRFHFLGRGSGAINVGGNKVQPEEVERVLLACPGVLLASVRGRPNPITGMIVAADIVQDPAFPTDLGRRTQISAHCRASLPGFAVPTIIRFVDDIGLTEAGKTVRSEVAV